MKRLLILLAIVALCSCAGLRKAARKSAEGVHQAGVAMRALVEVSCSATAEVCILKGKGSADCPELITCIRLGKQAGRALVKLQEAAKAATEALGGS